MGCRRWAGQSHAPPSWPAGPSGVVGTRPSMSRTLISLRGYWHDILGGLPREFARSLRRHAECFAQWHVLQEEAQPEHDQTNDEGCAEAMNDRRTEGFFRRVKDIVEQRVHLLCYLLRHCRLLRR